LLVVFSREYLEELLLDLIAQLMLPSEDQGGEFDAYLLVGWDLQTDEVENWF
jgi:hypothetical protein